MYDTEKKINLRAFLVKENGKKKKAGEQSLN